MRSPFSLPIVALAILATSAIVAPGAAFATSPPVCPEPAEPGIDSVLPADGASGVTSDAYVRVRYTADYFAVGAAPTESITLTTEDGTKVAGTIELVGDRDLFFVPSAPLAPGTLYDGHATSSIGFDFSFRTGDLGPDSRAPALMEPSEDPAFDLASATTSGGCEGPSGSRRVGLTFTSASDDGPPASLEYNLYLTRGPGVNEPVLVATARNYSASTTLAFVLPPAQLEGVVCVVLSVVDGVGKVASWRSPTCFDPIAGTTFYGLCSAAPAGRLPAVPYAFAVAFVVLAARRLGRRPVRR